MIILQVGQAGIQAGQVLLDNLCDSNMNINQKVLKYPLNTMDQLCVDTERKVWMKLQKRKGSKSLFQERYIDHGVWYLLVSTKAANLWNTIYFCSGRANNWAFGYFGGQSIEGGVKDHDLIMEAYRKIVEATYKYDGCLMVHSLAGGTGSGLGSRLVEEIRQEYGKAAIMTASFAPFRSGETAVQSYNSLLSLAVLQEYADFIGYFSNDFLMAAVERSLINDPKNKKTSINMDALNVYAATCLAGHILPLTRVTPNPALGQLEFHQNRFNSFSPLEFIYNVTPMPLCKYGLFSSWAVSEKRSESWDDIFTNMLRNVPIINQDDLSRTCVASHLTLRGVQGDHNLWTRLPKLTTRWQAKVGKSILEPTMDFSYIYGLDATSQKQSADTCFNSDIILQHIDPILSKARMLYDSRAYLHCYERYSVGQDVKQLFQDSFESLETVRSDYSSLQHSY